MVFNSYIFLIFFPVVVLIHFLLPKRVQYLWLLAASYYFYMNWDARYVLLLLFSTAVTYLSGIAMEKVRTDRARKSVVAVSFVLNVGVLFFFKYFNFAVDSLNFVLMHIGLAVPKPDFNLLLPVGISFYTFQALSYTMDVYRKDIAAERNFFRYALFVSFFPQLVAGPIERSKNLLSQVNETHRFDYDKMREGLLIMLWGYFLKLVVADRVAIVVNTVYGDPTQYGGAYIAVASVLFAVQIYCDFAGYSTIAIGAAKILGFQLMENFDCPYFAKSVAEFWRRWHISLTSWFRDYLYIPLGGNQKGTARKYLNVMIVFLVSGLWHGAQWTYIVWGGLNGLFQVVGSMLAPARKKAGELLNLKEDSFGRRVFGVFVTFVLVDLTWIFFRASSIQDALHMIKSIFTVANPWIFTDNSIYGLGLNQKQVHLLILSLAVLFMADWLKYKKIDILEKILEQDLWCRWTVYLGGVLFVLVFGIWGNAYDAQAFVYFQF